MRVMNKIRGNLIVTVGGGADVLIQIGWPRKDPMDQLLN